MENKTNFVGALVNVLYVIFIYGLFILPWSIWAATVKRLGEADVNGFTDRLRKTEFMVLNYLKMLFDAFIFLIYIIAPIIFIIRLIQGAGFGEALLVLVGAYFSPLYVSLIKEAIILALVQVMKIEEIADNTKKDMPE